MQYFDHMALFVAVVKNGSFSKTADSLAIAQSSLSRKINELEKHLGVKLLHRTTRKLQLTSVGRLYFEKALTIVDEFERTHLELGTWQQKPTGVLKLSVISEFALEWLSPLLPAFYANYPDIALRIDVSPHKVDLLSDQVDMVIRAGLPTNPTYIAHHLTYIPFLLYTSKAYKNRFGVPTHPNELNQHFCLAFEGQTLWHLTNGTDEFGITINAPYQSNSYEFLKSLTKQGLGISLLPALGKADEMLIPILQDWKGLGVPIVILTATRLLPLRVKCMIDFLKENAKDNLG